MIKRDFDSLPLIYLPKVTQLGAGLALGGVVFQEILPCDRVCFSQAFDFGFADFGVGGQENHLMGGGGEVAIDQVGAVGGVEASEGCVDRDGEVASGDAGESPEK